MIYSCVLSFSVNPPHPPRCSFRVDCFFFGFLLLFVFRCFLDCFPERDCFRVFPDFDFFFKDNNMDSFGNGGNFKNILYIIYTKCLCRTHFTCPFTFTSRQHRCSRSFLRFNRKLLCMMSWSST